MFKTLSFAGCLVGCLGAAMAGDVSSDRAREATPLRPGSIGGNESIMSAGGTLYTVREADNVLVKIDIDTLTLTDVGPLGISFDFGGLAYDANSDTLYMLGGRPSPSLYTVDVNTGAAALVGSHGVTDMFGLAFDTSTDTLYGITFTGLGDLYRLNTSNGSATFVGNGNTRIGGLAYNSVADDLVGINDGGGDLYRIDRSNGNQTLLYEGPFTDNSGLAYDPVANYYWDIDWSGNLIYFDIDNGYNRVDVLSNLGSHDGLAYVGDGPAPCLRLDNSGYIGGQPVTWTVSGGTPGFKAVVVYGFNAGNLNLNNYAASGRLWCATIGIAGVNPSKIVGNPKVLDANGEATWTKTMPLNQVGNTILTQAVGSDTCPDDCQSSVDSTTVQ